MEEASRSRVTITLGRSGQVVKRPGLEMDAGSVSYSHPSAGRKRPIRDRLGSNADPDAPLYNKRQQREGTRLSVSASDDTDDVTLTKDDLRFKIMRKNPSQNSQQKGVDLRDLLSRPAQSSTTSLRTRQHLPELRDTRDQTSEPRHVRPQIPMSRNSERQLLTDPRDGRQSLPEHRNSTHLIRELKYTRQPRQEPSPSVSSAQIRPSSSTRALPQMESLRHAYSPWTLDSVRRRSPDRYQRTSRGASPPRRNEELGRRPLSRAYDDSRASSYMSKDALVHSRSISPSLYRAKAAQTAIPAKPMLPPIPQVPTSASLVQKSSYAVDQYTVDAFLHSLGLEKYCINFKAEEVDMNTLRQMSDSDLKELGIPMGPRKKILLTLLSRSKRQL